MTFDIQRNQVQSEPAPASRISVTDCVVLYLNCLLYTSDAADE